MDANNIFNFQINTVVVFQGGLIMFTKKQYEQIADLLAERNKIMDSRVKTEYYDESCREEFREIVYDFVTMLENDNPKFNGYMFLKRCFDE